MCELLSKRERSKRACLTWKFAMRKSGSAPSPFLPSAPNPISGPVSQPAASNLSVYRWYSVHKLEPLVFKLLGVYNPVLTPLPFPCILKMVLKPKKWITHQVEKTQSGSNKSYNPPPNFRWSEHQQVLMLKPK